jgi:2,4-dienoyl-CoA reductase-like NADH-dependent reductase (Old Yellow Enzyme family)
MLEHLKRPIEIHSRVAPNRIVYHPSECNDADLDGNPTELTLERYREFAEGAPGLIFVEACGVTRESRGREFQLGATRANLDGLRRIVDTIRAVDPRIVILFQISHDGRRSGRFSRIVSAYPSGDPGVHVLTTEEIVAIEDMFAESAAVVEQAGADGIDFKNCNGYLPSEILNPANERTDGYGGSFEERTRFFRETVEKIKARVSRSFILGARISTVTTAGGFGATDRLADADSAGDEEPSSEFLRFARLQEEVGMHYVSIHVSNATYNARVWVQMPTHRNPDDVFVHFRLTRAVKETVGIPVMGAGYSYLRDGKNKLSRQPSERSFVYWAEENLRSGGTDMLGVSRQSLADHRFARKILEERYEDIQWCTSCNHCFRLVANGYKAGCVVHDHRYKEIFREFKAHHADKL